MTKLLTAFLVVPILSFGTIFGGATAAQAAPATLAPIETDFDISFNDDIVQVATKCPSAMREQNACEAYLRAADAPLYSNAKRAANDPAVSCLQIRSRVPSVLLVYRGGYVRNADAAGVSVITRFRQMGDWKQLSDGTWAKMLCIPKRWMANVTRFTICGEKGHYSFNAYETQQFKRQHGALTADDVARMWSGG